MIPVFTSASLWGCLDVSSSTNADIVILRHFHITRKVHEFVTNIILTQALTCLLNAVSAICWGSFADL